MSNQSMNCGEVKRLLPPYLDEEVSGGARGHIVSHLASCSTCRRELEALKADMDLLEQVGTPEVSPFLVTRVMAEVRRQKRVAPSALARLAGSLAAVLVVALSIGAGVLFGSGLAQTATPVAENSTEEAFSYIESSTADVYAMMAGGD